MAKVHNMKTFGGMVRVVGRLLCLVAVCASGSVTKRWPSLGRRLPLLRARPEAATKGSSSTAWKELYKPNYVDDAPLNRMQLTLALNRLGLRPS